MDRTTYPGLIAKFDLNQIWSVNSTKRDIYGKSVYTGKDCLASLYKVCMDQACATVYTGSRFTITANQLSVNVATPSRPTSYYLGAYSSSITFASSPMKLDICGYETLSLFNPGKNISLSFDLSKSKTSVSIDLKTIFNNSDTVCPITTYNLSLSNTTTKPLTKTYAANF